MGPRRLLAVAVIATVMTLIGCDQSVAPSPSPSLPSPSSTAAPTPDVARPTTTPASSPRAPATTSDTVTLSEGTLDWETYGFELTRDNEIVAGSYDGATKVQRTFRTWVLENGFLKVTLVPEYGGRIISIVYKPTGHEELYRNPVGVPYQIGTGVFYYNWLMVYGGIFPTFPEPEHGKTWLLPWDFKVISNTDQEVTVAMSIQDDVADPGAPVQYSAGATGISATFSVTLRAGRAAVDTSIALNRPADGRSPLFEYWTCVTLAPGSDLRSPAATAGAEIIAPMQQVAIPDYWAAVRGQEAAANTPGVYWFRNLRRFRNWPDMGIAYAYPDVGGTSYWGVINRDNEEGLFRIADNTQTPGLKLWTWGYPQSMAVDPQTTNSEIRPYVEMWAGLTRQFYEKTYLPGTGELTISETYAPSVGLSNVTHANANFLVNLGVSRSSVADVQVFGMVPGETVDVQLTLDGVPLHTGSINLDPLMGNTFSVPLSGGSTGGTLQLVIRDQAGTELFDGSAVIGGSGQYAALGLESGARGVVITAETLLSDLDGSARPQTYGVGQKLAPPDGPEARPGLSRPPTPEPPNPWAHRMAEAARLSEAAIRPHMFADLDVWRSVGHGAMNNLRGGTDGASSTDRGPTRGGRPASRVAHARNGPPPAPGP